MASKVVKVSATEKLLTEMYMGLNSCICHIDRLNLLATSRTLFKFEKSTGGIRYRDELRDILQDLLDLKAMVSADMLVELAPRVQRDSGEHGEG